MTALQKRLAFCSFTAIDTQPSIWSAVGSGKPLNYAKYYNYMVQYSPDLRLHLSTGFRHYARAKLFEWHIYAVQSGLSRDQQSSRWAKHSTWRCHFGLMLAIGVNLLHFANGILDVAATYIL